MKGRLLFSLVHHFLPLQGHKTDPESYFRSCVVGDFGDLVRHILAGAKDRKRKRERERAAANGANGGATQEDTSAPPEPKCRAVETAEAGAEKDK